MKKVLVLTFIIICSKAFSQKESWSITYTPAIIELTNIRYGLQLGGAYNINSKLQLLTEFTIATEKPNDITITNTRYFRIKPELRYFVVESNSPIRGYVGLQTSFASRSFNKSSSGSFKEKSFSSDSVISYSSAKINSPIASLTIQTGAVLKISNHFYIDGFIGMGARSVFTNYSSVTNAQKELAQIPKCRIMIRPDPAWWVNGTITRLQLNSGLRLLYQF